MNPSRLVGATTSTSRSGAGGGDEQVLPLHDPATEVEPVAQGSQVGVKGGGALGVVGERAVDGDGGAVGRLEVVAERGAASEAVDAEDLLPGRQVGNPVAEKGADVVEVSQSGAGEAPGGGAGAYGFMVAKS